MPAYSGKFQYLDTGGAALQQGPCQFSFDAETAILTPTAGAPLAFDLGDIDQVAAAEWELTLLLFTGRKLLLRQFGAAFERLGQELLAAWRDRTVHCLLLEDLKEVARFTGFVALGAAAPVVSELRLYGSNLAVLPTAGLPIQWRLAEVDSAVFDDKQYSMTLESAGERMTVSRLAKRTDEFVGKLQGAIGELHTQAASALHQTFPFLNPDALQRLVAAMPEGRSVPLPTLGAIDSKLPDALIARAVTPRLKPYFDILRSRSTSGPLMAGFKFIREDEEKEAGDAEASEGEVAEPVEAAGPEEEKQPLFFWFFFPLANGMVAWEASTGSGRATYFFRVEGPLETAVGHLTRGLALVNFRREPVYLSDDSLAQQQKFHRYAIGCRKMPDLKILRAAYVKRAIHTSPEAWQGQLP